MNGTTQEKRLQIQIWNWNYVNSSVLGFPIKIIRFDIDTGTP
jgi:hypothetical protein